ncbi:MAG TPA: aminotransferase class V-fold PLP-dependent enzyme [Blastocatellia bacterium]|jgi:glutamate/tyrosine decarboxylase-like PLP-dependent enzyme|nr:aminotransferase class V-fold PLP-dependent enzyme [Blastocatellia bacterium]
MLTLNERTREELWRRLIEVIENYLTKIETARVAPKLDIKKIRGELAGRDFDKPAGAVEALDFVAEAMWRFQVHTGHPRYFGLFNPASTTMGIAADALVAAFNPQLAAWSHSPFAAEVERHLVRAFGQKFGYDLSVVDGVFTSGGSEANHTALLTALAGAFPEFSEHGLRALAAQPVFYVSSQGHHSFLKAARASGLGAAAVREIPVDGDLRMDVGALTDRVARDRAEGFRPLMIVATAGTTSSGVIDPIDELAEVASREGTWFHVDAAWGGAAAFVPELRASLGGIEKADSITFDAHKWLSAPMGAGLYLTRHSRILHRTFGVATSYMPRDAEDLEVVDPFTHSIQWSRRFIGLKVFMSLLVAGWEGYAEAIRHQTAMGDRLRRGLQGSGWGVVNRTPLPVVCFVDRALWEGATAEYLDAVCKSVVASGEAWLSIARIGADDRAVLRACVTNYRTEAADVDALVESLNRARIRKGGRIVRSSSEAV